MEAGAGLSWSHPRRKPGKSYAESRENCMHALRHFYASVLLDAGENIKALAEYLGHSDPGLTLRVYAHLMPSSQEGTRNAVAQIFSAQQNCNPADSTSI
ncbi:integrase [Streptomyces canus]|nr:integrase [Streptomyces canus]